jgi:AraC-like DNA-binding protein
MYINRKKITPEFVSGYSYLIDYYRQIGNKEKQLYYITKFMRIDSVLQKNYKNLNRILLKEYDTPHLFAEKENLIKALHKKQTRATIGILILLLIVLGVGSFGGYQYYQKKQYRKRFAAIIFPYSHESTTNPVIVHKSVSTDEINIEEQLGISTEIIAQLLEKLVVFEKNIAFLDKEITIQKLSLSLNTNTKYLSKVINESKGKTFVNYINDLRVDYASTQLQLQPKLRNYTIQSLANEFGFNSAVAFSAAFYKRHKIKPTYFIKELENLRQG